jgi:hypothetical protein
MRVLSFFISLLLTLPVALSAQQDKVKIGILPVKYVSSDQADAARQVTNLLYNNFTNSKRAYIINREFFNDLLNEKHLTSSIDFIDGETFSKTKSQGAKYLLVGQVATCRTEQKRTTSVTNQGSTTISYDAFLSIGLRLVDVESGENVQSYTLDNQKGYLEQLKDTFKGDKSTPTGAITAAIDDANDDLKKFLDKYFPVEAGVTKVKETKDDKATSIMIDIGTDDGVEKKTRYLVRERVEESGQDPYYETVGEVEVEEVNGKSRSSCKVLKGGKEILSKINSGAKLVVVSK